jgi:regulator of sigma E protease
VTKAIVYSTSPQVAIAFERGGSRLEERIVPDRDEKLRLRRIGIYPPEIVSVEAVPGSAADEAGVRSGDIVTGVEGKPLFSWEELVSLVAARDGLPVPLTLLRRGERVETSVTPRMSAELKRPAIGVRIRETISMEELEANGLVVYLHRDPFSSIGRNVREMYLTLKGLLLRAVSPRGLAGPLGIIQVMSSSARVGLRQFLYVIAFISVNLAVLNLLPVPVLDGGHILISAIEGVKRGPLSTRAMTTLQNIFVAIFITLMVLVFANDVMRTWGEGIYRLVRGTVEIPNPKSQIPK